MPSPSSIADFVSIATESPIPARSAEQIEAEREAVSRKLAAEAFARDNLNRWQAACPADLQTSDWDDPRLAPHRAQIDAVLGYQIARKGIIATGATGRGKSRAMWALMRRLSGEPGIGCTFWHSHEFFAELGAQIRFGDDCAPRWVSAVARHRVVFIDDFGQEAVTKAKDDWSRGWFFRFCDMRVGAGLPLFITTNLSSAEMAGRESAKRGDPLVRRILDLCQPVQFGH
jgi:DNA replication protein DnaC